MSECSEQSKKSNTVKLKVTVSVTYHKDFEVEVEEPFVESDLIDAIKEMEVLPNDIINEEHTRLRRFIRTHDKNLDQKLKKTLIEKRDRYKPWFEDELEVIPNF